MILQLLSDVQFPQLQAKEVHAEVEENCRNSTGFLNIQGKK